jgi:OOP family OmpA-OmpF porin
VTRINDVMKAKKLKFPPGSAEIEAGSAGDLNDLAAAFEDCQDFKMEVAGHTDSQGRDEMNLQLSEARAQSVIDALLARRVLTSQLVAKGYGETQPIGDNETEEGRESNRRIEIRLLASDGRIVVTGDDPKPADVGEPVGTGVEPAPVETENVGETISDEFVADPDLSPERAPDAIPKPRPERPDVSDE